ncbi:hypothetical protein K7X08_021618 [Anisodus acutangulus]|uniref:Uncharacterized protein n=1 Tax=Anisodus acutangulus TaxID=402998 RepID=A0A9Q1RBF0_9SOLA|nr:hypothetical protein K7X08_021618 [Anisodus acutangulus]
MSLVPLLRQYATVSLVGIEGRHTTLNSRSRLRIKEAHDLNWCCLYMGLYFNSEHPYDRPFFKSVLSQPPIVSEEKTKLIRIVVRPCPSLVTLVRECFNFLPLGC